MRRGTSLVETLIVVAVIAVLAGVLLPAIQSARAAAARTVCKNNLHQIGVAWKVFADTAKGRADSPADPLRRSWRVRLLPFLEQTELSGQYVKRQAWDAPANAPLAGRMPAVFACPHSQGRSAGLSSYDAPEILERGLGPNARAWVDPNRHFRWPLAVEVSDGFASPWLRPNFDAAWLPKLRSAKLPELVGGNHQVGFHVLAGGGHVQFLPTHLDPAGLAAAFSETENEGVPDPQ